MMNASLISTLMNFLMNLN